MPDVKRALETIHDATGRLVRTVEALRDGDWQQPSLLPDWTRGHVVAHLALNAEALTSILDGLSRGTPVAMYRSNELRDQEIGELVEEGPAVIRDRLLASGPAFLEAVEHASADSWEETALRTPTGPPFPVAAIPAMRLREVEIHHADLDAGYVRRDWPAEFVVELLDEVTVDQARWGPFRIEATDLGASWLVGGRVTDSGVPVVTGRGADLGWWLTGRGHGDGLHVDAVELPRIGPWRRTPGK